jgi:hypothetical protein
MNAKCQCPSCKKMLKEEKDMGKDVSGEYRIYDSIGRIKGQYRVIECLEYGYLGRSDDWRDIEELGPTTTK